MVDAAPRLIATPRAVERAGELVAEALLEAAPRPRLAIPGGSAAAALAPARARLGALWSQVRLTWVDERCVRFDDPESNRGAAWRAGLLDDAAPPALELALYEDGEEPAQALARVTAAWYATFEGALDVTLLGMGPDGHIASLFPHRPVSDGPVAYVGDSPKPPPRRITLTHAALRSARATILLATGESKRAALVRLLAGGADLPARSLPARSLPAEGLPRLTVVTDLEDLE